MAAPAHIARENGKKGGRPKGSTTVPQFRNYVSDAERKKFVEFILDSYMGDMRLAVWLGDQLFGKAPQPLTGGDGLGPIAIEISEAVAKKNGLKSNV
jgi:hypothetical protein